MDTITLEAAQKSGFEPRTYSPFFKQEKFRARVDFLAEMGASGTALFFRAGASSERAYAKLDLSPADDGSDKTLTLVPYLQRNDLCEIAVTISCGSAHVRDITLIQQEPICAWREQCDKRSPCCVFKS